MTIPSVLFVCVKNGGKSQMSAGLMRQVAGGRVTVDSAGTAPGSAVNALSAEVLVEVGVDISGQVPKAVTDDLVRGAIGAEHYTTSLAETVTACLKTVRAASQVPEMAPAAE